MDQAKMKATQLKEQKELLERKKGDLEMQLNEVRNKRIKKIII